MNSEYSFKDKWLVSDNYGDQLVYEILSFGTVNDLQKAPIEYQEMIRDKLIRLSMINFIFGKNEASFSSVIEEYQNAGIELDSNDVEMILLELNDRGIVRVLIDSVGQTVDILCLNQFRDIYCDERELLVLNQEDLMTKSNLIEVLETYIRK